MDWVTKRQQLLEKLLQASRVIGQIEGQLALIDEQMQLEPPPTNGEQSKE